MPRSGSSSRAFRDLLALMQDSNVWVKVSGADRATRQGPPYADAVPFARKLVAEFGDRVRLGHRLAASQSRRPDPRRRRCWSILLAEIAPSEAQRQALLVDNPQRFYRFAPAAAAGQGGKIMSGRLQDSIAIVTGAGCVGPGWGNGRATAVRFAEEGAKIFAVDRDLDSVAETVERVKAAGGEIVTASMRRHRQCLGRRHGDGLRRSASAASTCWSTMSAARPHGGPVEMAEEVWDAQVDFNLKSVFLTCKHVLPVMEKQKSGAIVNVASTSGIRFTGAFQVGYAATKAGVIQLSRVVAVQYAAKGIRVNTVVPGQLHTPMVEARLAKQRAGGDVEALLAQRLERIPAGFMGDGRDTANAALFLASDEARFVTGTEIVVDGGMTVRCD